MTTRKAPRGNKRVVIASDVDGELFVVGSVFSDAAAISMADQVKANGWTVVSASSSIFSRAEFTSWPAAEEGA